VDLSLDLRTAADAFGSGWCGRRMEDRPFNPSLIEWPLSVFTLNW
jgi:hypothetical protein